jgi:hypothetical protein
MRALKLLQSRLRNYRFLPISRRIVHVQANLGVGTNTDIRTKKCAVSKMLAVASCRWALSRSQHASVAFNECGWIPHPTGPVYKDSNGPIKLLKKFAYKCFIQEYSGSYNLIATDQFHENISTIVCNAAAEKYAAEYAAAEKYAAECTRVDAGVPPFGMDTRNSKETHAKELALRFLAVKVGENPDEVMPQYISATFHGTHKESLEQKQCNLRLILSALKDHCQDLGLPCVLSGDLNLKHNEIEEIYLKHGFRRADGFCAQFLCMETALYPQMPTSPSPTSAHLLNSGTNCKFRAAIFTEPESSPGTEIDHVLTFKPKGSSWRLEVQNLVRIDDPEKVLDHPILTFEVLFLHAEGIEPRDLFEAGCPDYQDERAFPVLA